MVIAFAAAVVYRDKIWRILRATIHTTTSVNEFILYVTICEYASNIIRTLYDMCVRDDWNLSYENECLLGERLSRDKHIYSYDIIRINCAVYVFSRSEDFVREITKLPIVFVEWKKFEIHFCERRNKMNFKKKSIFKIIWSFKLFFSLRFYFK